MKEKYIHAYLDTASRFAELSTATRLKVGAVIVKDDRIISIGYNGTPPGWDNNCEERICNGNDDSYTLKTKPEVLHAEMNALMKLAKQGGTGSDGADLFITHSPCIECAKNICSAGIKKVFYKEDYRDSAGIDFLTKYGLSVEKVVVTS